MNNQNKHYPSLDVLGTRIDMIQIPGITSCMLDWIRGCNYGKYIVVSNTDTIVKSKHDNEIKKAVNNSSLSVPDGMPLVLLGRVNGFPLEKRAYGPDLMLEFLRIAEENGYSHFFYGSTEEVLCKLIKKIKVLYPKTKISGFHSPPFKPLSNAEEKVVMDKINTLSPDVLWVGLGCPKQELWMYVHSKKLYVPVMVGVGAAFEFLAGTKPQAPRWIRDNGFEWLFRLLSEPKRLWRRYLINNSLFIYYLALELFLRVFSFPKSKPQN